MLKFPKILTACAMVAIVSALPANAESLGIGRTATPEEIAAWDIDVRPDGKGLPAGKGSAVDGEVLFIERCASCHGEFAEGVDRWPVLAGGHDTLKSENPVKTIGSYWPYLSTVFDYINRAMPFGDAQSLKPDESYALVAYILSMNDIVDENFVLTRENFTSIKLPNEANFIDDPRPERELNLSVEPCMKDCKENVVVTMRARVLDVTPDEDKIRRRLLIEKAGIWLP